MKTLFALCLLAAALLGFPAFAQDMSKVETIVGIGAVLNKLGDGRIEVTTLIANAPAERAGILVGDAIIEVTPEPGAAPVDTHPLSLEEVVRLIRGTEGTTVQLRILRGASDPILFSILRQKIEIEDES